MQGRARVGSLGRKIKEWPISMKVKKGLHDEIIVPSHMNSETGVE